ncbi:hypothetical protein [Paenibacillus swuensis]|uniref:hypothetical protein n=1 Tax=Paenibacillus swuensis TaxID=1178515 RepID=UPI001E64E244|nr:hypothetical protein [Paenibacillus swuensis]
MLKLTIILCTIQNLNKLIKKESILISELEQVLGYVEISLITYLNKHYRGGFFVFYVWGDYLIPAIRVSIVTYYEGLELPFECSLYNVNDIKEVLLQYKDKAHFEGITIENVSDKETR